MKLCELIIKGVAKRVLIVSSRCPLQVKPYTWDHCVNKSKMKCILIEKRYKGRRRKRGWGRKVRMGKERRAEGGGGGLRGGVNAEGGDREGVRGRLRFVM